MIDVFSLSKMVGTVTLQRGLEYARRGAVSEIEIDDDPLRVRGQILGSGPYPYWADVSLRLVGPTITSLTGICSCPVSLNCKHVVALVVSALSQRRERASSRPQWERLISPLAAPGAAESENIRMPLGLQFELQPVPADRSPVGSRRRAGAAARRTRPAAPKQRTANSDEVPVASRLGIRPVQLGAGGRWVRTGISWSNVAYPSYGIAAPDPDQLDFLHALTAVADVGSAGYYGSFPTWLFLGEVGSAAFWDLLARAGDVGIPLVGSDKAQRPVHIDREPVEVVLDIVRNDAGLCLEAAVRVPGLRERGIGGGGLMLGLPVRAAVSWAAADAKVPLKERTMRLARFREPPDESLLALLADGPQSVPVGDEPRFLNTYLPALRERVRVLSHDGSFDLPPPLPPELWLTVTHSAGHQVDLRWAWRYAGTDASADKGQSLWPPQHRPAAYRQFGLEADILARVPQEVLGTEYLLEGGRLAGRSVLSGMQTVGFLTDVLPALHNCPDVHLDVAGDATYRAAQSVPVIGISGTPGEGRDWFDLEITVTVDGEPVPLREVFLALATGQEFMILPNGTYFRMDSASFSELRRLIEEATLLAEPGSKTLRVSRFQSGLWDELRDLGVVDEQAERWQQSVSGLLRDASLQRQPLPPSFRADLRPYQQDGFDWLSFLFDAGLGGILADDMGLGKTLQALALMSRAVARPEGSGPFLVVAPTSVVGNWKSEAARFAPHLQVETVSETTARAGVELSEVVARSDVVVTSYALFRLEFDAYQQQKWAGLILDEAQFVKNHQSLSFKNAKSLSAPFKLAITGTPMENNLMELWALFSITAPGLFGGPTRFAEFYQKPIEKQGDADKLALLRRRIKPLMLRRNKDQVVAELPPKQEQVLELELNARHRNVYQTHLQQERKKVLGLIGDLDKNRFTIFRSLTLLRRLSLDASLVDEKYAGVPSTKLDALMEQLDDVVAEGHRVLVFSQFTSFLAKARERLDAAGIAYCYLDGQTRRRPEVLERFASGAAPVFLISLKAGGFGLNLTEADYCILLDPWWNPATEAQAVDRAHRIGQRRTVMVYRMVAKGTIEEKVMALKAGKAQLFANVMADEPVASTALTAEDIRSLLS